MGEAAVSANIVSPILIIIVATTAICSFAIPSYEMNFSLRIFRFIYVLAGFSAGFLGIGLVMFVQLITLSGIKSFGVDYLSPYMPITNHARSLSLFLHPLWKAERRPDFLNAKRKYAENKISMKWKERK